MKIKNTIIAVLIGVIVGVAGMFALDAYMDRNPSGKVKHIDTTTIEYGLHDIGELATESYNFTKVATFDSTKQIKGINIPFTKSKFIYFL